MKIIKSIHNQILFLESIKDIQELNSEEEEELRILSLCYELISRTQSSLVSDQKKGNYSPNDSALADFSFALATETGQVSLKTLLTEVLFVARLGRVHFTQQKISALANIRQGTISDFVRGNNSITSSNWEKIVNCLLKYPK